MLDKIRDATIQMVKEQDKNIAELTKKLHASGFRIYQDDRIGDNEITIHVGKNLWKSLNSKDRN